MPERLYQFTDQGNIGPVDYEERACVSGERLLLRPLDVFTQTQYDRNGVRLPAIVMLHELVAEGISETYGFWAEFDLGGGSVGFQVSTDAGTTWLRWNGSAWVADSLWSTREEVDEGFPDLPLPSPKRILVRLQLSPSSTGKSGPRVSAVSVFYELSYQWEEDLLRSLKHFLEETFSYAGIAAEELTDSNKITIESNVAPRVPVRAYNLTDDPERLTNIGTSISGQVVNLSSNQTGVVEVSFKAVPPVFITANVSLEQSASLGVILGVTSLSENKLARTHAPKLDWSRARGEVRSRPAPVWDDVQVRIQCQSPIKREAEAMVESLATVLQYDVIFHSDATGEEFIVKGMSQGMADVIGDGLFVQEATLALTGRHWLSLPYESVGFATELIIESTVMDSVVISQDDDEEIIDITSEEEESLESVASSNANDQYIQRDFTYLSQSVMDFGHLGLGDTIIDSDVIITVPYNDPAAIVTLGLRSATGCILASNEIDPTGAGTYNESADFPISANDAVRLQNVPGASTQGAGRVILTIRRA